MNQNFMEEPNLLLGSVFQNAFETGVSREHTAIALSTGSILALQCNAKGQASPYQKDCFSFLSC